MNAPRIDTAVAGRSYLYEIGKKRPDGKFNIWKKIELLPQQWEWVIVHVADGWRMARDWILDLEKKAVRA